MHLYVIHKKWNKVTTPRKPLSVCADAHFGKDAQ